MKMLSIEYCIEYCTKLKYSTVQYWVLSMIYMLVHKYIGGMHAADQNMLRLRWLSQRVRVLEDSWRRTGI